MSGDEELVVELEREAPAFEPGEAVRGVAGWRLSEPPRSASVRLIWFTQGKGTQDVRVVTSEELEGPLGAEEGRVFRFVLPEGPYSFSGKLVSVVWAVELVVQPGSRGERAEIVVGPGGKEVSLHQSGGGAA
jgi:hypothetical protein